MLLLGSLLMKKSETSLTIPGIRVEHDVMDVGLVNLGVAEDLLDRVKSATEQILVKLFETSTSERGIVVE
jgi:hypothetical protein